MPEPSEHAQYLHVRPEWMSKDQDQKKSYPYPEKLLNNAALQSGMHNLHIRLLNFFSPCIMEGFDESGCHPPYAPPYSTFAPASAKTLSRPTENYLFGSLFCLLLGWAGILFHEGIFESLLWYIRKHNIRFCD